MKALLFLAMLLITSKAQALDGEDLLHITSHFGGVYAITHVTEVACVKVFTKEHKTACTVTGVIVGNSINTAYKASEGFPHDSKRSIISGAAGSAAAALTISLDF